MDFIEFLENIREEERINNLVEGLIATDKEKEKLEKLAEKNVKAIEYFLDILNK
ncbi:MAG: hypothetical protein FWE58_04690 [Methanobrevibacter sp.]|nr:hypothetical protein [Methanobrevibacter sp.]